MSRRRRLAIQLPLAIIGGLVIGSIGALRIGGGVAMSASNLRLPAGGVVADTLARAEFDAMRPPVDDAVSPEEAGTLYRQIIPLTPADENRAAHPAIKLHEELPMLWDRVSLDSTLFPEARRSGNGPARPGDAINRVDIFKSVARRLNAQEREFLSTVASDSTWRAVDRAARARRLDIVSASFTLPIDPAHPAYGLPIPRQARMQALSDGIALRAAHFVSVGRRDSAEAAIGSLYSLGLRIHDDALSLIEALQGQRLMLTALQLRRALHEALPVAGSERLVAEVTALEARTEAARQAQREQPDSSLSGAELRQLMIERAGPGNTLRGLRLETLGTVGFTNCASLPALLMGPGDELTAARADAYRTLARSAADSAYLTYLEQQSDEMRTDDGRAGGWFYAVLRWTSGALSSVTTNPRFRACGQLLSSGLVY